MTSHALLAELQRRGVRLAVAGDKLRYAPRSAVEPDLLPALREHKPRLLRMLAERSKAARIGENEPARCETEQGGAGPRLQVHHELSLVERVESGYVNPGWQAHAWADRLRQLAGRCEQQRPELAAQYRTWATNVENNGREFA